ncbi:MAG: DUF2156 domain-containing protein [Clostridia bacterium]|nr:DUF2156 domain-containing protein [Clostridia bacterium]
MDFKKVSYDDLEIINAFYHAYPARQCDRSTAATVMWRNYYDNHYAIYDGTIIFSSNFTGNICFTYPIGKNVSGMLDELEKHCRENGIPMTVCGINKDELPFILEKYPDCKYSADRDWFDYLYEKDPMLLLAGRKYGTPRNHINKFKKLYPDYSFDEINDSVINDLIDFSKKFSFNSEKDESARQELEICIEVLKNYKKYNMYGGYLHQGEKIIGYSFGEIIGDTLFVHIEKADVTYQGAYQMLTNSFLRTFASDDSVKYVNREEDCGDEGLRKSKLSYHPVELIEKNTVEIAI